MVYCYINDETNHEVEIELSMKEDIPKEIEIDGKKYRRKWGESSIVIPENMKATAPHEFSFDKSPSRRKHFY